MDEQRSPLRPGLATGLVLAGATALIVTWVLGDDIAAAAPGTNWVRILTVAALGAVLVLAWWRRRRPDDQRFTRLSLVVAALPLVLAILALAGFADQYGRGFPGRDTMLAAVGGLAVAAGVLLLRFPGPVRWPATAGAVVLVAAVAVPLALTAPDWRVRTTTAEPAAAAPVPDAVSRVAWSTPIDGRVRDVVAAGTGVVLRLEDRVVALDGTTGQIRWTRQREGTKVDEISASPDGRTVLIQVSPPGRGPTRREVLDAVTGELRFLVSSAGGTYFRSEVPITDASFIGSDKNETEFSAHSVHDGSRMWTFRPPDGCGFMSRNGGRFAVATGMLLPMLCGRTAEGGVTEFRYVAVDGTTGAIRWTHAVPLPPRTSGVLLQPKLAEDRRVLAAAVSNERGPTTLFARFLLDTETGAEVPVPMPLDPETAGMAIQREQGRETRLIDLATGQDLPAGKGIRDCAGASARTFLKAAVVCTDPATRSFEMLYSGGQFTLFTGGFGDLAPRPLPITLGGPFADSSSSAEPIRFVPAPGALVVTSELTPAEGKQVQVIGLR